ncbi:hypothetical protein GCM10017674_60400 [Streptomyces gardneri]|uniref:Uncharacterized protein n=1 Tax=Streptomyces gardneri TaxID=66892 RepID=A0A4Y3RK16_9ACTN|nr:hypothetical protein SGA01_28830 [Streptomyces gardneri]GHH13295.1 hypothetical protein GCM10017674_60400 [Streptomyces gardneri]
MRTAAAIGRASDLLVTAYRRAPGSVAWVRRVLSNQWVLRVRDAPQIQETAGSCWKAAARVRAQVAGPGFASILHCEAVSDTASALQRRFRDKMTDE